MNKMYILLLTIFSLTNSAKYHSDYYNNFTNILNRYPKVDIDYIFSKSSSKSAQEEKESKEQNNPNQSNNPSSDIFRNIFYDYYQTSVPLYDEKMKCYFPIKKNISLHLDTEYDTVPKTKNISKFLGKHFLKSLKEKCETFYIERWYYTLCPLLGATQTLSYIKSQDTKEKQEVNYLGYDLNRDLYNNNTIFLENLDWGSKNFLEKKYSNELNDIYEENLYDNNAENSKIIGVYYNVIKFYGNNVFDASKFKNKNKIIQIEYMPYLSKEKKIFSTNILKVISNNLILINKALDLFELSKIKKIEKIKILKQDEKDININNNNLPINFFNQSFFIFDEYVYSSKINLLLCSNKNCFVTISNDEKNVYRLETVIDPKFGILDRGLKNSNLKNYENEIYCLFMGDDNLYFFGAGDIEELTETEDSELLILYGEKLNIENSDEIILLFNGTLPENDNVLIMNTIIGKFIRLKYVSRINETHYHVKLINKQDKNVFDKDISLDDKYIIVKYNNDKTEYKKSREHKYIILGNEKNISLDNKTSTNSEKKEGLKIKHNHQINNTKEEKTIYPIPNKKEFVINFELIINSAKYKESYISLCFSDKKKCAQGNYEILFDLINYGIIINKVNNNDSNEPIAFAVNENVGDEKNKYSIIYTNSSIYINSYFGEGNTKDESEIILKYKLNEEKYNFNYMLINLQKSGNIYINDIKIENSVSFDLYKNIYIYNQKYLLDDSTIYTDILEKGDYCEPIKANRKVIINYSCDEEGLYDLKLMKVYEDKKNICVYNYYAKSRLLCNPNTLMKNYKKFSPVNTLCYLDN